MNQNNFERMTLGPLLTLKKGKKPISQSHTKEKGMQPYVDIKAFETGVIDNYTDDDKCVPCEDGDLLIVCDGSRSGYVGRAIKGYIGSTLAKISAEGVDNSYLYYFIQGMYRLLNTQMKGTGTPHLNVDILRKAELVIPSLKEQKRVVNKIEELFSELDSAVETLKKTKEQLAVYRQSVMKEAFESLDHPHNMLFDSLLENMRNGYGKKPDDAGSFKILRISSVRPMAVVLDDFRLNKTSFSADDLIQENDLLFTRYNGSKELVGVCASVPHLDCDYAYPDKIIRCRLKDGNVVLSKYLQYYFNQGNALKSIRKMIKTTSGQNGIAGSDLKKLNILMVNPEMQRKVVDFIEQKISLSNKIEKTVNDALIQADAMRQSILKKAFEGSL